MMVLVAVASVTTTTAPYGAFTVLVGDISRTTGAVFGDVAGGVQPSTFGDRDMLDERSSVYFRAPLGAASSARLRLALFVALVLGPAVANGLCGEHETCSGLSAGRRALIKTHLFGKKSFTKEDCGQALVGHVLHYKPTENCEEASEIYKRVSATCLAESVQNLVPTSPARLCETPKSVRMHNYYVFHIIVVLTSGVFSEWLHYSSY